MKCIRFYRKHGGHIARVSDDEAHQHVAEGRAMYERKQEWKAARAKAETEASE